MSKKWPQYILTQYPAFCPQRLALTKIKATTAHLVSKKDKILHKTNLNSQLTTQEQHLTTVV
jgi:hypothetical protein